jgi:hypothetical protein
MAESNLTAERLRELLSYDPETGLFTWKVRRNGFVKAGSTAGTVGTGGYVYIRLDNRPFMAHRLAWFFSFGEWPAQHIDHINGVPSDNRLSNIRPCSRHENMQNTAKYKNNTTGLSGAYLDKKRGCFTSVITHQGKQTFLGTFASAELAHAAYIEAKARLHTFQPTIRVTS